MHVTVLCSGLPGLGPQAVVDCAVAAWRAARPQDVVVGLATSEGIDVAHVGTGLGDVVCFHHPHVRAVNLGQSTSRRWWRWDDNALIDLADSCSWTGSTAAPRRSSAKTCGIWSAAVSNAFTSIYLNLCPPPI